MILNSIDLNSVIKALNNCLGLDPKENHQKVVESNNISLIDFSRAVAQSGSALAWGARGRKFKSCRPDHAPS